MTGASDRHRQRTVRGQHDREPRRIYGVWRPGTQTLAPTRQGRVDSPPAHAARSWRYVLRKTVREFSDDECTDLAAALTYYAVLASSGRDRAHLASSASWARDEQCAHDVADIVSQLGGGSVVDSVHDP